MIAYIKDDCIWADVVTLMAHGVIVRYLDGGMEYKIMLDRSDVTLYDEDGAEVDD